MANPPAFDHTAVVIGTGFGACMTALPLARTFKARKKGETILMLERGTWWTTPVGTVQDKEVKTFDFLKGKNQPVQFWPSQNHFRGLMDIITRCYRRPKNEDGLYDFTQLGKPGLFGLFGRVNDGVTIIRANGVGGGSLVYSNITIRPPDLVLALALPIHRPTRIIRVIHRRRIDNSNCAGSKSVADDISVVTTNRGSDHCRAAVLKKRIVSQTSRS